MNAIDKEDGLSIVTSLLTKKLTAQFTIALIRKMRYDITDLNGVKNIKKS